MASMAMETEIRAIPYTHIRVKSPDASSMDFCGFGLLKRGLGNRRPTAPHLTGSLESMPGAVVCDSSPCVAKEPPAVEVEASSDSYRIKGYHTELNQW